MTDPAPTILVGGRRGGAERDAPVQPHPRGLRPHRGVRRRVALELIRARRPDLVMLDVMLPDLDGWSVCGSPLRRPGARTIPVVIFTAKGSREDFDRGALPNVAVTSVAAATGDVIRHVRHGRRAGDTVAGASAAAGAGPSSWFPRGSQVGEDLSAVRSGTFETDRARPTRAGAEVVDESASGGAGVLAFVFAGLDGVRTPTGHETARRHDAPEPIARPLARGAWSLTSSLVTGCAPRSATRAALFALTVVIGCCAVSWRSFFHLAIDPPSGFYRSCAAAHREAVVLQVLLLPATGASSRARSSSGWSRARGVRDPAGQEGFALDAGRVLFRLIAVGKFFLTTIQVGTGASLGRRPHRADLRRDRQPPGLRRPPAPKNMRRIC